MTIVVQSCDCGAARHNFTAGLTSRYWGTGMMVDLWSAWATNKITRSWRRLCSFWPPYDPYLACRICRACVQVSVLVSQICWSPIGYGTQGTWYWSSDLVILSHFHKCACVPSAYMFSTVVACDIHQLWVHRIQNHLAELIPWSRKK